MEGKGAKISDGFVVYLYNEEVLSQILRRPNPTEIYSKNFLKVEFCSAFLTHPVYALHGMCTPMAATSASTL